MKQMKSVTKTASFCSTVRMHLGVNAPVFFEFKIGDLGRIHYFIAPKVDDE